VHLDKNIPSKQALTERLTLIGLPISFGTNIILKESASTSAGNCPGN
jgi:hypothetical protein